MTEEEVLELYKKERRYQVKTFGDYSKIQSLNLASFISFLHEYVNRATDTYTSQWKETFPEWFLGCSELDYLRTAPVKTYEILIEIMALAGAALETYLAMDVNEWRKEEE